MDDMFALLESNKTHVVQATQKHISIEWKEYIISRINKGGGVMGDKLFKRSGGNDFQEGYVGEKLKFIFCKFNTLSCLSLLLNLKSSVF